MTDATPTTPAPETSSQPAHNTNILACLAYIGPLILVAYIMGNKDSFVKYHVRQGAVLFVIEIAVWALGFMLWSFWPLLRLVDLAMLVLSIIGIINVVHNKEKELPLVGSLSKHVNI